MAWTNAELLEARVARILSDNNYESDTVDEEIISSCLEASKQEIITRLRNRGYSLAQINEWARQKEFHLDIGTWYALLRLGFQRGDEEDWIEVFDRREELDDIIIVDDAGDILIPAETPTEGIFDMFDLEALNEDLDQEP